NPNRALGLRNAIDSHDLWPLEKLVTMHAGDVVRLPGDKIEAFYAQNWAFVRFLWDYNDGEYRERFRKLLSDTATGSGAAADALRAPHRLLNAWSPSSVKPMLEAYLGKPLGDIEKEYREFIHHIAYEQFNKQWMVGST